MGDLLEFTTSPNAKRSCYMISSGALKFHVKGSGSAAIGLANKPNENYVYEIIIGNQYSSINSVHKVKTVNIISEHTYSPFWITWYGSEIRIGKGDNPKPFLVDEELIDTINYISFLSFKQHTMYWKFRLPPKIKEPIYKNIDDGQLKWVKMDGNCLPEDALIGGYEDEVLYIMRAMHEEALTPGKFVPSKGAGYVAWGYDAHVKTDMETPYVALSNALDKSHLDKLIQIWGNAAKSHLKDLHVTQNKGVLCGYDSIWIKSRDDEIPRGAVEGGYSEVNCETLYVGRSKYDGHLIPGKVQKSHKILCGYDGIWVPTEGDRIPAGALVGGLTEYHETMFVGRALHNNFVIPGKIAPSHKILCGYNGVWVKTAGDRIPPGALVGGLTEYHETLFVGRALHDNIVIPGKIAPSHKVCYIPYDGREIAKAKYEILITLHSSNEK